MIAVIQRVTGASVEADGEPYSEIGQGLLVLLGVASTDNEKDAALLSKKLPACAFSAMRKTSLICL